MPDGGGARLRGTCLEYVVTGTEALEECDSDDGPLSGPSVLVLNPDALPLITYLSIEGSWWGAIVRSYGDGEGAPCSCVDVEVGGGGGSGPPMYMSSYSVRRERAQRVMAPDAPIGAVIHVCPPR